MYRKLNSSRENILGYHLSGTITKNEVREIERELNAAIERWGKIRMLVELGDLSFPTPAAVWQDLKFTPQWVKDVERAAVVGNATWQQVVTKLAGIFSRGEARYFDSSELQAAWDWVQEE